MLYLSDIQNKIKKKRFTIVERLALTHNNKMYVQVYVWVFLCINKNVEIWLDNNC